MLPAEVFINNKSYPHKYLHVKDGFRDMGLAKILFKKSRDLDDVLETECVSDKHGLKEFYEKMGYKVVRVIRNKITDVDFYLLKI